MAEKRTVRTKPFKDDFEYYEAEIEWLRMLMEVRVREADGKDENATAARRRSMLPPDTPQMHADRLRAFIDERLERNRRSGPPIILDGIQQEFKLETFDRHVLLLALAPLLDTGFSGTIRWFWGEILKQHSEDVEVKLALTLFGTDLASKIRLRRRFGTDAPLLTGSLVYLEKRHSDSEESFLCADVILPRRIYSALVGSEALDDDLIDFSTLTVPLASLDQVVLPEAHKALIVRTLANHGEILRCRKEWGFDRVIKYGRGLTFLFCGPPGTGKTMTAHAMANRLGLKVMLVDASRLTEHSNDWPSALRNIFREAKLSRSLLFFDECELLLAARTRGNGAIPVLLQLIEGFDGIAVFATNMPKILDPALDRRILVRLDFEIPTPALRAEIWRTHVPNEAPLAADVDFDDLAERFDFSGGYVKNAVLMAVHAAAARQPEERIIGQTDFEEAARLQVAHRQGESLGDAVMPEHGFDRLVLEDRTFARIREITAAVRRRGLVVREWEAGGPGPGRRSIGILFHGPSGTGKTLAASALANELCLPVLRVRPDAIFDKWLGETEKNLRKVFEQARAAGALILFDEADAMFATRETATQRHDLNVTNLLLAEMERFEGVVVLTTNRREAIDQAFFRRLLFHVEFQMPGVDERVALWRLHLGKIPLDADVDLTALARSHALTGGGIRNAVMRAAFALAESGAGRLTQLDLARVAQDEAGSSASRRAAGFAVATT